ncbi:hypothetical protein [Roseovarius sp.]|uniref:hypothetical protein n=1 Tax=Roseovarius sp. TaxID=1486281 RepID=UPI003BACAF22
MKVICIAGLALLATPLRAEMDFVTDRALCGLEMIERHERGMSFDGKWFSEIEYSCELSEPIPRPDWTRDATHIRPGYCEEPGALYPKVFVLRTFQSEPGLLYVYEDETGSARAYFLCSD